MMSNCQLKVDDFYNIPIGNVKNWCINFLIKKCMCFMKTCNFI